MPLDLLGGVRRSHARHAAKQRMESRHAYEIRKFEIGQAAFRSSEPFHFHGGESKRLLPPHPAYSNRNPYLPSQLFREEL